MTHIKDLLAEIIKNASKAKFYSYNQGAFLRYFDNEQQYKALILAGNFEKMEKMIKENSTFKFDEFEAEIKSKMRSK
jgi:anaerobic ribonucleoside-triphosphate reductase